MHLSGKHGGFHIVILCYVYSGLHKFYLMPITHLRLLNFRNHVSLEFASAAKFISITGANGSGKTNVLEAVSLIAPGTGMRSCKFDHIVNFDAKDRSWGVMATIAHDNDENLISTRYLHKTKRHLRINDTVLKSGGEVLDYLRVIWLTPRLDCILAEPLSVKRKFFDRICYNYFPAHAASVARYEKALCSRSRLLADKVNDDSWFSGLEEIMAIEAIKIAQTRDNALKILQEGLAGFISPFTKPHLSITGELEDLLAVTHHEQTLMEIKKLLKNNRAADARAKRTLFGSHKSELVARHHTKGTPATFCSTGEQKAMLVSLILAQCFSIKKIFNGSVVLLLDDIFSHLDQTMKNNLLQEIIRLDIQAWLTATEESCDFPFHKDHVKIVL
jgi:DNA replication and repair protein RecF